MILNLNEPITIGASTLLDNTDSDTPSNVLWALNPSQGTVTFDGANITYTPIDNFIGQASFDYAVSSGDDVGETITRTLQADDIIATNNSNIDGVQWFSTANTQGNFVAGNQVAIFIGPEGKQNLFTTIDSTIGETLNISLNHAGVDGGVAVFVNDVLAGSSAYPDTSLNIEVPATANSSTITFVPRGLSGAQTLLSDVAIQTQITSNTIEVQTTNVDVIPPAVLGDLSVYDNGNDNSVNTNVTQPLLALPNYVFGDDVSVNLYVDGIKVEAELITDQVFRDQTGPLLRPLNPIDDGTAAFQYSISTSNTAESALSNTVSLLIDTIAPDAPTTAPDMSALSDTGTLDDDNLTSNTMPGFMIDAPADATPILYINGVAVAASYDASTQTVTPMENIENGVYEISYALVDGSQKISAISPALSIEINDALLNTVDATLSASNDVIASSLVNEVVVISPETLLANDTDSQGGVITPTGIGNPMNGEVVFDGTNILFTPTLDYTGPASFTYTISNAQGETATAMVNLTIAAAITDTNNQAPIAMDDVVPESDEANIVIAPSTLLANDSDPDGDAITAVSIQDATNGSAVFDGTNVIFTPDDGYTGPATFTYTIADSQGATDTATVSLMITANNDVPVTDVPVNDVPVTDLPIDAPSFGDVPVNDTPTDDSPVDDVPVTANQSPIAMDDVVPDTDEANIVIAPSALLANDSDPDGDAITAVSIQDATNGSAIFDGTNVIFTPDDGYTGPATFTYTIADSQGATDTATVNLMITVENDIPVTDTPIDDAPIFGEVPVTDAPVDDAPTFGEAPVTDTPVDDAPIFGEVPVTDAPVDDAPTFGEAPVTDTPVDDAPTFGEAPVTDAPVDDAPTFGEVPVTDVPVDDTPIFGEAPVTDAPVDDAPTFGEVPVTDAPVDDTPIFGEAPVTDAPVDDAPTFGETPVTDAPVDDAPTFGEVPVTDAPVDDTPIFGEVPVTDAPVDDAPTFGETPVTDAPVDDAPTFGEVPVTDAPVIDTPTFGEAPVTDVPVNANQSPIALDDAIPESNESRIVIAPNTLLANDSDPDGDAITAVSIQDATNGSAIYDGTNVIFTPIAGYTGAASFTYTVADNQGATDTATVNLMIAAGNDLPSDDISFGDVPVNDTPLNTPTADIVGDKGDNQLIGTETDNVIFGDQGNDQIDALAGNDTIVGSQGNDVLEGGAGSDTFVWSYNAIQTFGNGHEVDIINNFTAEDKIDLRGILQNVQSNDANLTAEAQLAAYLNIRYDATAADNGGTVIAISALGSFDSDDQSQSGDQTIVLAGLDLTQGNSLSSTEIIRDMLNNDNLMTDAVGFIEGKQSYDTSDVRFNDTLNGDDAQNQLSGDRGDDVINAGAGDDMIQGGQGNDVLSGGFGADTFVWEYNDVQPFGNGREVDIIQDMTVEDKIDLRDLLQNEQSNDENVAAEVQLDAYLNFEYDASMFDGQGATIMDVSALGSFNSGDTSQQGDQTIIFAGFDLTQGGTLSDVDIICSVLDNKNLITDALI